MVPEALRWDPDPCSIARTLELVGEKWSLLVLREVFSGVRRFDDFHLGPRHRMVVAPFRPEFERLADIIAPRDERVPDATHWIRLDLVPAVGGCAILDLRIVRQRTARIREFRIK